MKRLASWTILILTSVVWVIALTTTRVQSQEVEQIETRCLASWAQDLAAHPNLPWRELNAFEAHILYLNARKFMSSENVSRIRKSVIFQHSDKQWHLVLLSGDCVLAVFLVTNEWIKANFGQDA